MTTTRYTIDDEHILEYATRWLPYGGGHFGDLLVEFGLTPEGYVTRLASILDGPAAQSLDPKLRQNLRDFVTKTSPSSRKREIGRDHLHPRSTL